MPSTVTSGQLENAQRIVLASARYTMEHNAANVALIEGMNLGQGEKQVTVPKVGQFNFEDLVDGVDLEDEQEIGMTTTDLTTGEVGAKIILTDKLARQENESVFNMVGRQFGDGAARKKDRDVITLYPSLNGGTVLGADNKNMSMTNLAACISFAKAHKFPAPVFILHHPNAVYATVVSAAVTPSATYPIPHGFSEDLLKDFYKFSVNQVEVFEDGNIDKLAGIDSGYGVIASKNAMVMLSSKGFSTERQRDASLRATELVSVGDYGCFELDDTYGAGMQYEIGDIATNA
jgi:hypothetical protein